MPEHSKTVASGRGKHQQYQSIDCAVRAARMRRKRTGRHYDVVQMPGGLYSACYTGTLPRPAWTTYDDMRGSKRGPGRFKALTVDDTLLVYELLVGGMPIKLIAEKFEVSGETIRRFKVKYNL